MLIKFAVKNYKSIKDYIVLDMTRSDGGVDPITNNNINYFIQEVRGVNKYICPVVSIFGPNASGKSNILKAFITMRQLVMNGETANFYNPFKFSIETELQPTELRIMFSKNDIVYDYGIVFDDKEIKHEFLKKLENSEEICVFDTHDLKTIPQFAWSLHVCRRIPMLRLAKVTLDDGETWSKEVLADMCNAFSFFEQDIIISDEIDYLSIIDRNIENQIKTAKKILSYMGMGFKDIQVRTVEIKHILYEKDKKEKLFGRYIKLSDIDKQKVELENKYPGCWISLDYYIRNHNVYEINMIYKKDDGSDMKMNLVKDESTGTRNLFKFILCLIDALKTGKIIAFDEIDRTIHTELICYIFKMIKASNLNTKNAQLICSSHNPCVMMDLDPREILIIDKNRDLSTCGTYLVEYDIEKKTGMNLLDFYLRGHFGGVPNVIDVFEDMEF